MADGWDSCCLLMAYGSATGGLLLVLFPPAGCGIVVPPMLPHNYSSVVSAPQATAKRLQEIVPSPILLTGCTAGRGAWRSVACSHPSTPLACNVRPVLVVLGYEAT